MTAKTGNLSTVFNGGKYETKVNDRYVVGDCLTQVTVRSGSTVLSFGHHTHAPIAADKSLVKHSSQLMANCAALYYYRHHTGLLAH